MAYARRTRAAPRRGSYRRSSTSYARPQRRRASASRSGGRTARGRSAGQTVRLVIEQAPVSQVSRPSYLQPMNPAIIGGGAPMKGKAKL